MYDSQVPKVLAAKGVVQEKLSCQVLGHGSGKESGHKIKLPVAGQRAVRKSEAGRGIAQHKLPKPKKGRGTPADIADQDVVPMTVEKRAI